MSKRGLPSGIQMRHDAHYVEELSTHRHATVGRFLSTESIDPNPQQPRVDVGDLTELVSSIKEKGILEPLLVKPSASGRWTIIAGERRWRASKLIGLKEVPCIEMDVDEGSVAEIALIENLQRKDLTAWEEADGFAALCEKYGYTHDDVAKKIGKSRTSVTESIAIASLPQALRELCRHADIAAKSTLLEIARQPDDISKRRLVKEIGERGLRREDVRSVRRTQGKLAQKSKLSHPSSRTFSYTSRSGGFQVKITFNKSEFETRDIYMAIEELLQLLKDSQANSLVSD